MKIDIMINNKNNNTKEDQDSTEAEKYKGSENDHKARTTILTAAGRSKIKIIKNKDCKSWTYHKGNLI